MSGRSCTHNSRLSLGWSADWSGLSHISCSDWISIVGMIMAAEKRSIPLGEKPPQCKFVATNPTWTVLESNLISAMKSWRLLSSYGTASQMGFFKIKLCPLLLKIKLGGRSKQRFHRYHVNFCRVEEYTFILYSNMNSASQQSIFLVAYYRNI
jgi:hypothetical protein